MFKTGIFNQPAPAQPAVEIYDLNSIAPQFSTWNFNVGQPYDQHTPQIALMTINEIQQHALQGHPIRVGAFNILSENGFNNPEFQDLLYVILMRIGHGMQAGEWRNLDVAVNTVIARAVKSCASAMAASDQQFLSSLKPDDVAAVRENAEIWEYLVALAQGKAQYVPFNQMAAAGSGVSGVNASTQSAMQAARSLRGSSAGAFVESQPDYGVTTGRYNNNAGATAGRYGRRAEKLFGKLEGSMQEALQETGLHTPKEDANAAPAASGNSTYQSRMQRPNPISANPNAARTAAKFDSDVTDFSKSLETTTTTEAPAEVEQKTLFTVQIGDEVLNIVRQRKEGIAAWKSSRVQRFHPAWCTRTHNVRYFEAKDGTVIAVLQELSQEQKEIAMNYDAHAIDPTMGQPEPDVPVRPVREEAKVLYAPAEAVTVNVTIADGLSMEEDTAGAIRSTRLAAEMSEQVPDAYMKLAVVNTPIVYPTAEAAAEDAIVIRAIAGSKDFTEAVGYLPKVRNDLARKTINDTLTQAVNRATECELGVGVRIGSFEEDAAELLDVLEKKKGALISEKLRANQTTLLKANVTVVANITEETEPDMKAYADATLTMGDQTELSPEMLGRLLFLKREICAVWVNFTDNEMAIGIPPKGPAVIQADSLGAVHKVAATVYEKALNGRVSSEQFLITKDNVQYRLHRGMINKDCYLLSKEGK